MRVKDGLAEQYFEGELSNRLYALDELNRREQRAADRMSNAYIAGAIGLGIFMILTAIISCSSRDESRTAIPSISLLGAGTAHPALVVSSRTSLNGQAA